MIRFSWAFVICRTSVMSSISLKVCCRTLSKRDTLAGQQQEPPSIDDVAAMIAGQIGQFVPMDEETTEQFRQLAKKMMGQVGGTQNEEEP